VYLTIGLINYWMSGFLEVLRKCVSVNDDKTHWKNSCWYIGSIENL